MSLSSSRDEQQDSYSCIPKKQRKKAVELKRDEVLNQCLNVLKEPDKAEKKSSFASYVAKKLEMFSPRNRAIAEKKMTDVLFAAEMDMLEPMAVSQPTAPQYAYILMLANKHSCQCYNRLKGHIHPFAIFSYL